MSSAPSDPGSFVIITQVRPQTKPGDATVEGQNENVQATMPKSLTRFYRGEPEALGVTQIFSGIVEIVLGVVLTVACRESCYQLHALTVPGVPLWSGIAYIISGAISLAASIKPTLGKSVVIYQNASLNVGEAVAAAAAAANAESSDYEFKTK
ncbi:hypothetical protein FKM82_013568 [Ascaphus truei]